MNQLKLKFKFGLSPSEILDLKAQSIVELMVTHCIHYAYSDPRIINKALGVYHNDPDMQERVRHLFYATISKSPYIRSKYVRCMKHRPVDWVYVTPEQVSTIRKMNADPRYRLSTGRSNRKAISEATGIKIRSLDYIINNVFYGWVIIW